MRCTRSAILTSALEDYLETIYLFVQQQGFARVRDIAKARNVKAGSVSPAMKRLAALGLIEYAQREYIKLTDEGERFARKIFSRHEILTRFFHEFLKMDLEDASADACALEHSLSDEAMDRLVRLFEFMRLCPERKREFWDFFHTCTLVNPDGTGECNHECTENVRRLVIRSKKYLKDMEPGETSKVIKLDSSGDERNVLIDLGFLPEASVEMVRISESEGRVYIKLNGYRLSIPMEYAEAILVE